MDCVRLRGLPSSIPPGRAAITSMDFIQTECGPKAIDRWGQASKGLPWGVVPSQKGPGLINLAHIPSFQQTPGQCNRNRTSSKISMT
jgi:hypothetical protein